MFAILVELCFTNKKIEDNDTKIKRAIQRLAEKYKDKAFDEQTLLDKLKSEELSKKQEIISRTKVQELVAEMDFETADNEPKITIYGYDKIIPRWIDEYDDILNKTKTIIYIRDKIIGYIGVELKIEKNNIDKIYEILSEKMKLSTELLKENNCISRYYLINGKIKFGEPNYVYNHTVDCLFIINDAVSIKKGDTIYLNEFDSDIVYLHEYNDVKDYIDYPMEITCIENFNNVR
jgi:hypothetical protein